MSAVTSGSKRFFLGTDSAPHDRRKKECSCGCAGIFNAFVALSVYAKVFEEVVSPSTSHHVCSNCLTISAFSCSFFLFVVLHWKTKNIG